MPLEAAAIDGQAGRGAIKQGTLNASLLSAVSDRLSTALAQVAVADRTNEIGQMEDLLAALTLTGLVVTAAAMHTRVASGGNDHQGWGRLPDGGQREPTDAQAGDRTGL